METKDFIIKNENVNLALLRFFWQKIMQYENLVCGVGSDINGLSLFLKRDAMDDFEAKEVLRHFVVMGFLKQKGNVVTLTKKGCQISSIEWR